MDLPIELDALNDPASIDHPPQEGHTHEVKSFVATPRDLGVIGKIRTWLKSELKPGIHVVHKDNDPLRYMILITSNSYEDREKETITTKALEEYEASCYPGEGLYHNDNRLVYWHDDDAPIGEIIAVNVSGPFLVEVAKELPTAFAKVIWDVAEATDHAGVSHRFGYLEKDRDPDGTFHRIYKDETTWALKARPPNYTPKRANSKRNLKRLVSITKPCLRKLLTRPPLLLKGTKLLKKTAKKM
jgi:hypothetical protein